MIVVVRLFNTVGPRQTGPVRHGRPAFVRQALDGRAADRLRRRQPDALLRPRARHRARHPRAASRRRARSASVFNIGAGDGDPDRRARPPRDRPHRVGLRDPLRARTTRPTTRASRSSAAASPTRRAIRELTGWAPELHGRRRDRRRHRATSARRPRGLGGLPPEARLLHRPRRRARRSSTAPRRWRSASPTASSSTTSPLGYKGHARPTPYLGGAAVMVGLPASRCSSCPATTRARTLPLVGGMAVLWVVGTIDDRRNVSPALRVAVEVALAAVLWALGLGWDLGLGGGVDLALTVALGRRASSTPSTSSTTWTAPRARWRSSCRPASAVARARRRATRWLAVAARGAVRRVPRLPAAQPRLAGADLPRRRRQHADRLRASRRW